MEHRRVEDTTIGRLAYNYPLIAGIVMVLVSVGGYLATLRYSSDRITVVESRADKSDAAAFATAKLLERISVLQENADKRITRIENNLDVIEKYPKGHER